MKKGGRKIILIKREKSNPTLFNNLMLEQMYESLGKNVQTYVDEQKEVFKLIGRNKAKMLISNVEKKLVTFIKSKSNGKRLFTSGRKQHSNIIKYDIENVPIEHKMFNEKMLQS